MTKYDPVFAQKPEECPGGCVEFVRINRYVEACPVCKVGRMSREWIEWMRAKHVKPDTRSPAKGSD